MADASGNIGILLLTTDVVDTTAPALAYSVWLRTALVNGMPIAWPYGLPWQSAWVSAQDSFDGAVAVAVTSAADLKPYSPGSVSMALSAADSSMNTASQVLQLVVKEFARPLPVYVAALESSLSLTPDQEQLRVAIESSLSQPGFVIVFPLESRRRSSVMEFGLRNVTTLDWIDQAVIRASLNLTQLAELLNTTRFSFYSRPSTTPSDLGSQTPSADNTGLVLGGIIGALLLCLVMVIAFFVRRRQQTIAPHSASSFFHSSYTDAQAVGMSANPA